jgi:uncharacterized membrane protein
MAASFGASTLASSGVTFPEIVRFCLRWEFFAVAFLWGGAQFLFRMAPALPKRKTPLIIGGFALVLAGVALLVFRFALSSGS